VRGLLYVDPSPRGEWALQLASLLPESLVSSWTLLATSEDAAADKQLLARARTRFSGRSGGVEEKTAAGPAERAVGGEAESGAYGLVLVPPAGRNALQRLLRGSRVATVVRSVKADVLVARRPPARIDRILAALSGGPFTRTVARTALELGRALGAETRFLHVVSEIVLPFGGHGAREAVPDAREAARDPERRVRAALRELGAEASLAAQEGLVVDEVLAEMENGAYPLLVVGARSGGASSGWGADDLAVRILLHCPASVLVVRRG
jgi:nucleotide-binding universal stress UspA family protein